MIEAIFIASLRATILAALTGVTLSIFRVRDAAFRHACWRLVLIAMIAMPILTVVLPAIELPFLPAAPGPPTASTSVSFSASTSLPAEPGPTPIVPLVYGVVAFAFLARWATGYVLGRRLVRTAHPTRIDAADLYPHVQCVTSDRVSVPMTFGGIRPVILIPPTVSGWTKRKLHAVLAHEAAHIRRRDFLTSSLAAVGKAVFWFHPLAWWLEWRLSTLAEQAADDAAAGTNPEAYAGILVRIARDARAGRVHGLAVVRRRGLERRVTRLLDPEYTKMRTRRRHIVLMTAVLVALAGLSASIVLTEASGLSEREESITASRRQEESAGGQPARAESDDPDSPESQKAVEDSGSEDIPVEAEPGRGNSQIQVTTRSGTNEYRSTVRWNVGNPAENANVWEAERGQEQPAQTQPQEQSGEASEQEEQSAPIYTLESGVRPPTVRERVNPQYSQEAREARIEGTVVIEAIVRRDGTIEVIGVTRGLDPGLDEEAVRAISQWRFDPGTKDGEPVDVRLSIEVNFTLR